jgi:hypothetical protein
MEIRSIYNSSKKDEILCRQVLKTWKRAGFDELTTENMGQKLEKLNCSIHFIGKKFQEYKDGISVTEYNFQKAKELSLKDETYKTFIWMPGELDYSDADPKQLKFIERMQQELSNNMVLSRVPYAIQFVEDVKLILEEQAKKVYDTVPTEVFLICNQTDEKDAARIQTMLSGILKFVKLVIVQDSGIDYEEFASQQMNVSRLSVVYYKNASEWALPFVQQIWKKVGGAAARSPILFISDISSGDQNSKSFLAANVSNFSIHAELIPLEIKVQFDALTENA